jgi:hypothetical protein
MSNADDIAQHCPPPANGSSSYRRRRARPPLGGREFELCGTLVLDGKRVPMGVCWVKQSAREVALTWRSADGAALARDIAPSMLRQLLDEGVLRQAASANARK